jgi:hypothetical protein
MDSDLAFLRSIVQGCGGVLPALQQEWRVEDLADGDSDIAQAWGRAQDVYDELMTQIGYVEDMLAD